jgi:hypothetical protein
MPTRPPTPDGLGDRLAGQLRHQLASLRHELSRWSEATAAGQPLEKHRSQVRSIIDMLDGYADAAESAIGQAAEAAAPGRPDPADVILDTHHVWDFFRSKLLQRSVDWFAHILGAADELAWACYKPALDAAASVGTTPVAPHAPDTSVATPAFGVPPALGTPVEPPLVFLNRSAVPFAARRGDSFRDLLPRGGLYTRAGARAAAMLPFPLIGIPWYHSEHLPGLLAVPHEVGHHIEDDLRLTDTLRSCLREAGVSPPWDDWLGEVFADLCACLACGESYVGLLLDTLATADTSGDPASASGGGQYPPARLRALVCIAALGELGFAEDAAALRDTWLDRWPSGPVPDGEAYQVAGTLLAAHLPELGATLPHTLRCAQLPQVREAAELLLAGLPSGRGDVRAVAAAAGLAFIQDPRRYEAARVGDQALADILDLRPVGPRAGAAADDEAALRRRRREAGRHMFELISGERRDSPTR